jgi:hypothetical protein
MKMTTNHHYTRRVDLVDLVRSRAYYFMAGAVVSPILDIIYHIYY